ncbi:MAG TPA: DNA polymerase IV, partial [Terriglobia bacterium]|nr:DNA polymerase IV [Terriglobia bacterium]
LVATADAVVIRRAAEKCLLRISLDRKLRLLGVRATALSSENLSQDRAAARQKELPLS